MRDNEVNIGLLHPQSSCFGTNDLNYNNNTGLKAALIYLEMLFNCQLVWEKTEMVMLLFGDLKFSITILITTSYTTLSRLLDSVYEII